MIQAIYHRSYNRLTVTGHAASAEPGHDLVCASASILAYTLAANVERLSDAGHVRESVIRLEEGDTEISCKSCHHFKSTVILIFDAVCTGFNILRRQYPEYVHFEIRD